ncbi:MAG TPA: ABC transporter ATP-binding protein [Myxococcota bacterium]|nr:ABC transporter ATP-binding protein [Myxococcota bacterium]
MTALNGVRLEIRGLAKRYHKAGVEISVLREVDLDLAPGATAAVVGPSGSGKSTFMHMIGLLDRPTSGQIRLDGRDVTALPEAERDQVRNRRVGFVFQSHNLLPELDAVGNVMVPVRLAGAGEAVARARAEALLGAVGLRHRLRHRPGELSGGEQQRVAIARALVMGPGLVLADEPTGNLDPSTAAGVFRLLMELNQQLGSTLLVVTHANEIAAAFPRRLVLTDGRFVEAG